MSKLETETSAAKTIQAYKDAATEIRLVLKPGDGLNSGDYPHDAYTNFRYIRRFNAVGKEHKKIVKSVSRVLVTERDEKGRPVKKEYLYYTRDFRTTNHKGIEYQEGLTIGKYTKPRIVPNGNITFDPKTGEPIVNDKILSGQRTVYEIEVPKTKEARKKLILEIVGGDTHPDSVIYYYRELDQNNYEQYHDASFTATDFVNCSIEELKDMSQKGAGSKSSPYYKDKEGNLKYKKTDTLVTKTQRYSLYVYDTHSDDVKIPKFNHQLIKD